MEAKSLFIGISILHEIISGSNPEEERFHGNVKDFVIAARVEEEFQIENWGLVEFGQNYDRLNCSIRITSAMFMLQSIKKL